MTSNLGADLIRRSSDIGFSGKTGMPDHKTIQEKIEGAMKKHLKPEFLNRVDGTVIFKALNDEALAQIVHLEIDKVKKRLASRQIFVDLTEDAIRLMVKLGNMPEMGARPLRRAIEQYVEDPLAEMMIRNPGEGHRYLAKVKGEKLEFEEITDLAHTAG